MIASKSVLIDCDPGIDDALALLLAFASPEIRVDTITAVYGNSALSTTLENVLKVLHVANVIPLPDIGKGCDSPLKSEKPKKRRVHGSDGLADTNLEISDAKIDIKDGVSLIIEKVLNGRVDSIIALGPLTNIACAVSKEPRIKEKIKELIIMGGALYTAGSSNSEIEFNVACDPDAAKEVFHSRIPIKLVSLDTTQKVIFKEEHLKPFEGVENPLSNFIVKIAKFSIDFNKTAKKRNGTFLNDPLAVGIALNSRFGSFENLCIDVELERKRGRIFLIEGESNISFCNSVKADEFLNLFIDRLSNYCRNYNSQERGLL